MPKATSATRRKPATSTDLHEDKAAGRNGARKGFVRDLTDHAAVLIPRGGDAGKTLIVTCDHHGPIHDPAPRDPDLICGSSLHEFHRLLRARKTHRRFRVDLVVRQGAAWAGSFGLRSVSAQVRHTMVCR